MFDCQVFGRSWLLTKVRSSVEVRLCGRLRTETWPAGRTKVTVTDDRESIDEVEGDAVVSLCCVGGQNLDVKKLDEPAN
jgi:hypothetical protein